MCIHPQMGRKTGSVVPGQEKSSRLGLQALHEAMETLAGLALAPWECECGLEAVRIHASQTSKQGVRNRPGAPLSASNAAPRPAALKRLKAARPSRRTCLPPACGGGLALVQHLPALPRSLPSLLRKVRALTSSGSLRPRGPALTHSHMARVRCPLRAGVTEGR